MNKVILQKKKNWLFLVIAVVMTAIGVFLLPQIFEISTKQNNSTVLLTTAGLVACLLTVICLAAFLRSVSLNKGFLISLRRTVATLLVFLCCALLFSLLFGLVSVLIYEILKNILTLNQIKGIIDFVIAAVNILILPLFISAFWSEVKSDEKLISSLLSGIKLGGKKYTKLLLLTLCVFGIGLLILTAFHYAVANLLANILKAFLLGIVGAVALIISDNICDNGGKRR